MTWRDPLPISLAAFLCGLCAGALIALAIIGIAHGGWTQ